MALLRQDASWQQETSKGTQFLATGDPLAFIYNEGMWRLNKVSPLYKLSYVPVKLKIIGAKIRQAIVQDTVQANSAKYTVVVEELPNLKYSEDDASALLITVSSSLDKKTPKDVYVAVLLSWGDSESFDMATHLPYMLERGEQKVGTAVKATLQTLYDCSIRQLSFTQHQILQFGFNFLECSALRSSDPFTLTYKTPQIEHREKLDVTFDVGDINIIWNGVKHEGMTQSEAVTLTYQILQNQIFDMISLDITVFDLSEISLPKAVIKNNGVVRMKTPEVVNSVFTVLNEIRSTKSQVDISSIIMEEA